MSLLVGSERVLVEGELRPAVLRIEDGRIGQVWWGTSDPGRVATVGDDLLGAPAHRAETTLRLGDRVLLPGVVDTHVHVNEPGRTHWEGFTSAARAAAYGGVTTIVDMPLNSIPPTTNVAALRVKQAAARTASARLPGDADGESGRLPCDVAFWGGAVPGNADDLEPLWDAGVMGFKCFLADSGVPEFPPLRPDELLLAMDRLVRFDGLLVVHAEDPAVLAAAPRSPSRAYADFLLSRPDEAETAAVRSLLDAVRETGARTHVLHVSSAKVLDLLAEAKAEGLPVTAETCHHYLVLAAEDVPDGDAAYKCCPPIRDRGNQDALWDGLREGILDCMVSDHSPSSVAEKVLGGPVGETDLQAAWGGISGLQTGFVALADAARRRGVPLPEVSRWTSASTAALVGLDKGDRPKGIIAEGAAADLLVYDPEGITTIEAAQLAHRNPVSAYDGLTVTGAVTDTMLGGRFVVSSFLEATMHGQLDGGRRRPLDDFEHVRGDGRLLVRPGSAAAQEETA
ncbi:allantoinase AllB [Antribacter gilvus]|uniref:allantoinase AllB n=1 Tax=Antribacter gilvus TaxID=2304675 RepID=UPI000F7B73A2|nr:allantoinase AllB [Antribacter gilvus]